MATMLIQLFPAASTLSLITWAFLPTLSPRSHKRNERVVSKRVAHATYPSRKCVNLTPRSQKDPEALVLILYFRVTVSIHAIVTVQNYSHCE